MKKIVFLMPWLLLLCGCYHKQTITFEKDLSGSVDYSLQVSDDFVRFTDHINSGETSLKLNLQNFTLSREIKKQLEDNNIKIIKSSSARIKDNTNYEVRLGFGELNAIPPLFTNRYFKSTLFRQRNVIYVRTLLTLDFLSTNQDKQEKIRELFSSMSPEEKAFLESFAGLIKLQFTYRGYSEIVKNETRHKTGTMSADKTSITFEFTLLELLTSPDPIEIRVGFRRTAF